MKLKADQGSWFTVAGLLAGYSKVVVHGLYLGTATVAGLLAGYSKAVVHGLYLGTATVNSSWTAGWILQSSCKFNILQFVHLCPSHLSLPFPPIFFVSYL